MLPPHLHHLQSEAIHILREVLGQFERSVILFSGGKDSVVLAHLAAKAFHPAPIPFPLLHIDTGHNFPETLAFRDRLVAASRATLQVRTVEDSIRKGLWREDTGRNPSRNAAQSITLMEAIRELRVQAAIGGGRRDEEKARSKERVFSHRNNFGQWEPKNQRPELWSLLNGRIADGEHLRVFPLSNWTERDIWEYVHLEGVELPSLYFSHERQVVEREGVLLAVGEHNHCLPDETSRSLRVRCRTVGDMTCTGFHLSTASTAREVLAELESTDVGERGGRADDRRSSAAMEDRKRAGYF